MALKEKASELRQGRATLIDEARTILERSEKDNRPLTVDERNRHEYICGDGKQNPGEAHRLAERISQIERMIAIDGKPVEGEERSGREPLPHEDLGNVGTRHRYSLMAAVKCRFHGRPVDGLEGEVHAELVKRTGKNALGFLMPYSTRAALNSPERRSRMSEAERRNLDSTQGAGAVPTILDKDWIELLRNKMVCKDAGMREIFDIEGRFAIPRQTGASTGYWVGESGAPTGTNQTLDQVVFTPKTLGAFTDISRRYFELANLSSPEEFVKEDLTAVLGRGVDLAAINGTGQANQPLGILQNSNITGTRTIALGTNGGAPTFAALVNLYTMVKRGNAGDLGEFAYVGNADVEGTCATTAKIGSTFPIFILEDGKIYAKRFLSSQQVPSNLTKGSGSSLSAIVGGVWNQLVAAYWSAVDILVDPYTGSSSGTVRIVSLQDMDVQVRHNEAFAVIVDMVSDQQ